MPLKCNHVVIYIYISMHVLSLYIYADMHRYFLRNHTFYKYIYEINT